MIGIKEIFKIVVTLVLIYVVGGFFLAAAQGITAPIKLKNDAAKKMQVLKGMMPEGDEVKQVGEWDVEERKAGYYIVKKAGQTIGYVIESYSKGYSSFIQTMLATDTAFTIKKLEVLYHAETPGLGDEILADWFKKQYVGKAIDKLEVVKASGTDKIQAITGATISSRAVTKAQRDAIDFLQKHTLTGRLCK